MLFVDGALINLVTGGDDFKHENKLELSKREKITILNKPQKLNFDFDT